MQRTKFTKMRLLLQSANELFDEGKITHDEFADIINGVENDYNNIVAEIDTQEISALLLNYIHKPR